MLKRISVNDLRLGMYIEEFCGSWLDHPFWRGSFVIDDPKDIQRIRESSVRELWIDASKGLDVSEHAVTAVPIENKQAVDQVMAAAENLPPQKPQLVKVSALQERVRARKIIASSKKAVASMFKEARLGKALQATDAAVLVDEIAGSVARNAGALILSLIHI